MLAKRTSKNQVTLPKAIVQRVGEADYYDVTVQDGKIVLTPVRLQQADAERENLEALGITQDDVEDAIAWARNARDVSARRARHELPGVGVHLFPRSLRLAGAVGR